MRLILCSASPRRAELLRAAGIVPIAIRPVVIDEAPRPGEDPEVYVRRLAAEKVLACDAGPGDVLLGADTVVIAGSQVLGKPADDADARRMLAALSGRTHQVLTAIAIRHDTTLAVDVETTDVEFAALLEDEISWYVATGEPRDKAGAYAIQGQGSRFVTRISGSYSNVVGLPIALVYRHLRQLERQGPL